MATDPICGMFVDERDAALRLVRDNRTYLFCSRGCLEQFAAPEVARRRLRARLAVAWPFAVVVLVLTYAFPSTRAFVLAAVLAGVVQVYAGTPFYRGAWDAIRSRSGNMDLLIAVGTTTAYGYSLLALALPSRFPAAFYFDASSLIVTLILSGNYLESLVRDRAGIALQRLGDLLPATADRLDGGTVRAVPVAELRPQDVVRVLPGARFPADGQVREGRTSVDESVLTGESLPVPKGVGASVLAGSLNGTGRVDVVVTRPRGDSFVAQVGRLLTEAEESRVPLRQTADRIAAAFVPLVLGLAVAAAVAWVLWGAASGTVGVLIFVSVVITACPCAFGIATPAAIVVGVGRAADEGILFRGQDSLERAALADVVLIDKTGTLTTAVPVVDREFPTLGVTTNSLLSLAAGVESGSEHAYARAVRARAAAAGVEPAAVTGVRADPGRGVRGVQGGRPVAVLDGETAREEGVDLRELLAIAEEADRAGDTWSVVVEDGKAVGLLTFRAPLVAGAAEAIQGLHRLGLEVVMVSGDREAAARRVGSALGLDRVEAGVRPEGKVALVRQYAAAGHHVAFVGDGINDAAALASADVGLAIGTGTDVAKEAGQVLLLSSDLRAVPRALELARRTVGQVRWNLAWALGYNAVLLPIAMGALVPLFGFSVYTVLPIAGAVAMALSSTIVVVNSLSLRWTRLASDARAPPVRAGLPH
ncbi:MAG TPA: heavy metal translocating P-type ATPase [Thermoplasmata archaeon]|nr:heavy metal translocating P-type ATPase [Thermoplasmata archaeon]